MEDLREDTTFSTATPADLAAVRSLLHLCALPTADLQPAHLDHFILCRIGDELAGTVGVDLLGDVGLLRSLAVAPPFRGRQLARQLWIRARAHSHRQGIRRLYLLTTTAMNLFARWGFRVAPREEVPELVRHTEQFSSICPSTATVMVAEIVGQAIYFPKDTLELRPDVEGAKMWGVALEKTLLSYFELEAQCRFAEHSHESEQITTVLSGELFFAFGQVVVRVGAGEVIAIPPGVSHEVYTGDAPARAFDAWSPVMKTYAGSRST